MTSLRWPDKDPSDIWDFTLDATAWLAAVEDDLTAASVACSPDDELTVEAIATTEAGLVSVRLSGGQPSTDYRVTMTLTTDAGRVLERSVMLMVRDL